MKWRGVRIRGPETNFESWQGDLVRMDTDADAAIDAFGKNEQVKIIFLALFVTMAGMVLARVPDPGQLSRWRGLLRGWAGNLPFSPLVQKYFLNPF